MGSQGEIQELKEQVRMLNEKVDMLVTILTQKQQPYSINRD